MARKTLTPEALARAAGEVLAIPEFVLRVKKRETRKLATFPAFPSQIARWKAAARKMGVSYALFMRTAAEHAATLAEKNKIKWIEE